MVKSWLVQDQTILGKDYSNLLIADSLLKTIWFINAPCYGNEALASPKANGICVAEKTKSVMAVDDVYRVVTKLLVLLLLVDFSLDHLLLTTIMANLPPPDHTADLPDDEPVQPEPAPVIPDHAPAQPDGYVGDDDMEDDEEEDPKEDPKEDPVEDPKEEPIEQVEEDGVDEDHEKELEEDGVGDGEEEKMEIDDEMDNSEVINLDETEEGKLPPPIPVDPEPEPQAATVGTGRLVPLTGRRIFTNNQVHMGLSSFAATGYNPKDLTPSHIRSDLNALHRRVRQIEQDDVRAENNRLRMMLDCSENCIRTTRGELDRVTWYYRQLRH
ncbi:hypothetical protein Tco_0915998 [Tanacetum coccineum]